MLLTHFNQIEDELLTVAQRPSSSGHSLHKGTPRESFVRNYLESHLCSLLAVGSGEVIDSSSRPGESRPQVDLVVYKRQYPKLHFGGGIDAFFAESVLATIEVKSTVTKDEFRNAMRATLKLKALARDPTSVWTIGPGYKPPGLLCFLVAYDGPAHMDTVRGWIRDLDAELGVVYPPLGPTLADRVKVVAPALDGVFVLGKGFVVHDTLPLSFITDTQRTQHPIRWVTMDVARGGLLLFFFVLSTAGTGVPFHGLNAMAYLQNSFIQPTNLSADG
jgi:hypothetical protein